MTNPANVYPINLGLRDGTVLIIEWSNGQAREYTVRELRDRCPCATCREERSQAKAPALLPVLKPAEAAELTIRDMKPVGSYAYAVHFSDGHDTGIFTLESLLELGAEVESGS